MWRWRHKSVHRGYALWGKLALTSLALHLPFLLWFFGVEHNGVSLSFVLRAMQHKPEMASLFVYTPPPPPVTTTAAIQPKVSAPQKAKTPTTVAAKKVEPKKEPEKMAAKKEPPKPKQDLKVAKKVETPKEQPKKVAPSVQKVAAQKEVVASPSSDQPAGSAAGQELAMQLQQAVMAYWAPPPGVDEQCNCTVAFRVDWDGTIQAVNVCEPSGVLMYDIAAKCALNEATLPSWTRGKNLTITFRQ